MERTKLIIVGGFLGAGKTTLLWKTAQSLMQQGLSVGLVTNDQAPELVDSKLLSLNNLQVSEVSGSCFCCNFNGFTDAIKNLKKQGITDIIIAEPVGSCADLSATLMQPLKKYWNHEIQQMPLTVMADPNRLVRIIRGENAGLHKDAVYIYRKQLEESDLILINKADLLNNDQLKDLRTETENYFPSSIVMTVSAKEEAGIQEWIETIFSLNYAGNKLVEMDYETYANGEAVLGWLNGTVLISGDETDWDLFTKSFLKRLSEVLDKQQLAVGHVKVITENDNLFIAGNITGNSSTIQFRKSAGMGNQAKIIINARVETSPENLERLIREELNAMCLPRYKTEIIAWNYLQPGRPEPTYRFTSVI